MMDAQAGAREQSCPVCRSESERSEFVFGGYQLFACRDCGLRFAPEGFGAPADYDAIYSGDEYESHQVLPLRESRSRGDFAEYPTYLNFFRHVRMSGGNRLLDIGCGVGRFCHGAHSRGWNVTGIDLSGKAVKIGLEFAEFPLQVCTLEEMSALGERFNVATAFEVLEHVAEPVKFLSLARQVLVPGGQLFCTAPNWHCHNVQHPDRAEWMPPIHLLFFTRSALASAAQSAGFSDFRTGVNWSDPVRGGLLAKAYWLKRRVRRRPCLPLGLWLHVRSLA